MNNEQSANPAKAPQPAVAPAQPSAAPAQPSTAPLDSQEEKTKAKVAHDARVIGEVMVASALSTILAMEDDGRGGRRKVVGELGVKQALDDFLKQAGSITDPIDRCMHEQFYLTHHRLVRLQVDAANATKLEAQELLNTAAARLTAEIRKLALAIREYRAPMAPRNFSVIHQQNVATEGGKQDVRYGQEEKNIPAQTKVNDKPNGQESLHEIRERVAAGEEPKAGGSGKAQRPVAAAMGA